MSRMRNDFSVLPAGFLWAAFCVRFAFPWAGAEKLASFAGFGIGGSLKSLGKIGFVFGTFLPLFFAALHGRRRGAAPAAPGRFRHFCFKVLKPKADSSPFIFGPGHGMVPFGGTLDG